MADYYPLIARAIAALDPNAPGESRRALYERARTALIAQLRSVQPPLSESEITRERLSLEEAVRKVESEAAQRAREASRPGGGTRSSGSGDAFRRASTRATEGNAPAPQTGAPPRTRPAPPPPPRADRPSFNVDDQGEAPRAPRAPRFDAPRQPGPPAPPSMPEPPPAGRDRAGGRRPPDMGPPLPPAPGVRGFRDITADANDLGGAAAQANRAARRTYANVPSPSPEFDRLEPSLENRAAGADAPYSYDESIEEAERYAPQSQPPSQRPHIPVLDRDTKKKRARTGSAFPFKSAIAVGIVLILVGAGILWGKQLVQTATNLLKSSPTQVVEAPRDSSQPQSKPKIPDRVGQPSASDQPVAPVAQKVVLYDEDPSDPKGKQYVGSVVWRLEPIKASGNQKADVAVRADIEIPDRKFKMTMSFRRNTDSSLPASHTAELTFVLPADFSGGGVANVPGILMKSNEQARGTPLAGLAVKVTDGFFLVGLSNVDADRSRNVQLLKERSWFDVPLVYANQRRAIIAIEKGAPGERAFNDAFAQWGD
ncbi:hypothetical protein [Bradyrhizobium sp. WSM471]|uniref:hypothetical protein n=1 Tax=Bradyrhizobium sp. WSM471 TaxID=319017 RepID=UPI00024D3449|nr:MULTISPECIES: hypothetical protein [Bradyrhizobium]EHR05438.1 hypothetical protein Bra471DRAFT_06256 [Bradyrhizobium sp. WSM471]UFW40551.1 hypothetical protein BcanWSM471_30750 [Bradyrhizobium canariense]